MSITFGPFRIDVYHHIIMTEKPDVKLDTIITRLGEISAAISNLAIEQSVIVDLTDKLHQSATALHNAQAAAAPPES